MGGSRIFALSLMMTAVPVVAQAQTLRHDVTRYSRLAAKEFVAQDQRSPARDAWQRELDEARDKRRGARKYFLFGAVTAGGTLVLTLAGGGPGAGSRAMLLSLAPAAFAGWGTTP